MSRDEKKSSRSVREFPIDILIDILSRVPSKSIARFRCVSKLWGSILQSLDFSELFLTRCPRILFALEYKEEILYFSSPQDQPNPDEKSNCDVVATRYNTSFPKYVPSLNQRMLRGLVFRDEYCIRKVRVVCNPATGECITLPKVLLKDKTSPKVKPEIAHISFGYDPINKQFKVLCLTRSNAHQVLTLENGKRLWRRIQSDFVFKVGYDPNEICIDGVLYFEAYFERSYGIVCFDFRSEKFSLVNIDKGMVDKGPYTTWDSSILINYKGKFGIYKNNMRGNMWDEDRYNGFDLWVLEDAGNHKWSKHEHLYPDFWKKIFSKNGLRITGMTSTGEMVFASNCLSNPFYIYYYNLERKTSTRVNIRGFEEIKDEKIEFGTYSYYSRTRIDTFVDYTENMKLFKRACLRLPY